MYKNMIDHVKVQQDPYRRASKLEGPQSLS